MDHLSDHSFRAILMQQEGELFVLRQITGSRHDESLCHLSWHFAPAIRQSHAVLMIDPANIPTIVAIFLRRFFEQVNSRCSYDCTRKLLTSILD